jgi:tryptophan-rich sensory protein
VNIFLSRIAGLFGAAILLPGIAAAYQRSGDPDATAACGCLGFAGVVGIVFVILWIVLVIALLVWVARDAKARGLDNSVIWMVLVLITGLLGLIIYLLARPKGNLIACPHCGNKRMEASAKCPHCGNA